MRGTISSIIDNDHNFCCMVLNSSFMIPGKLICWKLSYDDCCLEFTVVLGFYICKVDCWCVGKAGSRMAIPQFLESTHNTDLLNVACQLMRFSHKTLVWNFKILQLTNGVVVEDLKLSHQRLQECSWPLLWPVSGALADLVHSGFHTVPVSVSVDVKCRFAIIHKQEQ